MQIRHGDVLLETIEKLPEGKYETKKDSVVAEGEVTGHAHRIVGAAVLQNQLNELFIDVGMDADVRISHEEHGTVKIPAGTWKTIQQQEYTPERIQRVVD